MINAVVLLSCAAVLLRLATVAFRWLARRAGWRRT